MSIERAYYILKNDSDLAIRQRAYEKEKNDLRRRIIDGLKDVFSDSPDVLDMFEVDQYYSNKSGSVAALIAKQDKRKEVRIDGRFKEVKNASRGYFPKQNSAWGRAIVKRIKKLTDKVPEPALPSFTGDVWCDGKIGFADCYTLSDKVILSWPYDDSKSDEPQIPADYADYIESRIRPWEHAKMIDEHNAEVKKEKK